MIKIKKILVAFVLASFLLAPNFSLAASGNDDYGASEVAGGLASNKISGMTVTSLIGQVINIALSGIGIIFFVLILYAGFLWMTAAGNNDQVTKAKNIIEAAVVGLVLISAAYAISNAIFSKLG